MALTFASGVTREADGSWTPAPPLLPDAPNGPPNLPGEVVPVLDPTAGTPDAPAVLPDDGSSPGHDEEAAVTAEPTKTTRPFVSRLIRENERLKQAQAAQAAQIAYLMQQLQPPAVPVGPPAAPAMPLRPQLAAYSSHEDWVEALTDWKFTQKEAERQAQAQQQAAASAQHQAAQQWAMREHMGRTTYDDYDEVVSQLAIAPQVGGVVAETFRDSEHGPALLYHLGTHPQDLQALNQLSPVAAARWLGQLEGRLTATPPAAPPRAGSPRPPAGGPAAPLPGPLQPVSGTGGAPPAGFRPGMTLTDYAKMRDLERQGRR